MLCFATGGAEGLENFGIVAAEFDGCTIGAPAEWAQGIPTPKPCCSQTQFGKRWNGS